VLKIFQPGFWFSGAKRLLLLSFVRPVCEYGSVAIMGVSAAYLTKMAEILSNNVFLAKF